MNLQEHINKALRENTSDKFLSTIKKHGLFHFLMVSQINPMILGKYVKYEELPKEIIYRFLDDLGNSNKISEWITDYYDSPLYFKRGQDGRIYEIQTFGYNGSVTGEFFIDKTYINNFTLDYDLLPDYTLDKLFEMALLGPFYQSIYKDNVKD